MSAPVTPTRRRNILRALNTFSSPARVGVVARAASVHDSNARHTIVALTADGLVERVGPAPAGSNDHRPVRITPAGRARLAELEAGAGPVMIAPRLRAVRLAMYPTYMLARDGERRECGRYEACLHGAALRVEYSNGAECPTRCAWETPPARESATEYTSSGESNQDASMYAGWP